MRTLHLFAGAGGGLLADLILGHRPIAAVEWEPYACQVLRERTADGWFPSLRVHECDVRLFDSSEYAGKVDCIHAGFPCQDISVAGKQAGVGEGTRSGLYREVLRVADEIRPECIFLENVAAITTGDDGAMLRTVVGDLAERGFYAVWCCLSAAEVGAKHKRNRWWCLAKHMEHTKHNGQSAAEIRQGTASGNDSDSQRQKQASKPARPSEQHEKVAHTKRIRQSRSGERRERGCVAENSEGEANNAIANGQHEERKTEPRLGRMANDVANRLDANAWNETEPKVGRITDEKKNRAARLKAIGNGQVPLQASVAFSTLWKIMEAEQ